jgi:NAD+ synthetase
MPTRVALAQLSPVVGDVRGNGDACIGAIRAAHQAGAEVVVATELALSGYPPRDLLERADLVRACREEAARVAAATEGITAIYGAPWVDGGLRNAAIVARDGAVVATRYKTLLPTYDVFDEARWFVPAAKNAPLEIAGRTVGITVCEDLWFDVAARRYPVDPVDALVGVDVLVNLSASPFHAGKARFRRELLGRKARQARAPVAFCNQVGGNDELLFDGNSMVVDATGALLARAPAFSEGVVVVELEGGGLAEAGALDMGLQEEVVEALTMGIRDYARRTGFRKALIGLSGGIDSALVAVLAVRALGAENVLGIGMPGPYSSEGSVTDARALATNLGIEFQLVPIGAIHAAFTTALAHMFAGRPSDVTEENLQARARGTLLMAISNKLGHLLLSTGNKSEMAVGYCTLYGDMNGGLAVIGDVFKTEVYALCRWLNREREVIPQPTIDKPPSAELAPGQFDQQSLPPYPVLDAILRKLVEGQEAPAQVAGEGFDPALVARIARMVARSEYKRWQAAPVLRVSPRAFGTGRGIPLAQRWT